MYMGSLKCTYMNGSSSICIMYVRMYVNVAGLLHVRTENSDYIVNISLDKINEGLRLRFTRRVCGISLVLKPRRP